MQRRAAAAYVVFFLAIAAGAYAVIATASAPAVSLENPDYELSQDSQLTVNGRSYTVSELSAEASGGGGHGGGGGGVTHSATFAWTVERGSHTETWEKGDEVEFSGATFAGRTLNDTYVVIIPNVSDPGNATLREAPGDNVTTKDVDGVTYVLDDLDGDGKKDPNEALIPITEYDGLKRVQVTEGQFDYNGNTTTVNVTSNAVTLSWTAPKTKTTDVSQAANVTLGPEGNAKEFFAYFPNNDTVMLLENPGGYRAYHEDASTIEYFHERQNGLWGITILSLLSAILLGGMAYMPRKDV